MRAADVRCTIVNFAYRFGIGQLLAGSRKQLQDAARRSEALELDFITQGDRLGDPAPFSLRAAAAAVTEQVRLRTYVDFGEKDQIVKGVGAGCYPACGYDRVRPG